MLEEVAIRYVSQQETTLQGIALGLIIFGAVIAAISTRSKVEIARAPYFAYGALILFGFSAAQLVWLLSGNAIAGGYLWFLMAMSLSASATAGYFFCLVAMARSRDAYGHGSMSILAFIPIANFWLLLTRSKTDVSPNRAKTARLLTGGLGVLSGFILFVASIGVNAYIEYQGREMEIPAEIGSDTQKTAVDSIIRSHGIEEALRLLAAEVETPFAVDEVTSLARVEADGLQLRRTYVVNIEGWRMTEEFRSSSRNGICAWPPFEPILRARGSVREVYVESGGREIGSVMVTRYECGF